MKTPVPHAACGRVGPQLRTKEAKFKVARVTVPGSECPEPHGSDGAVWVWGGEAAVKQRNAKSASGVWSVAVVCVWRAWRAKRLGGEEMFFRGGHWCSKSTSTGVKSKF